MQGLAAERGGVVQGDELLAVDGTDVSRRPPFDAASLIARPLPSRAVGHPARASAPALAGPAPAAAPAAAAEGATRVSLLLRGADGRTRRVEMERARAREVTNPVRYRLRSLSNGARKVGYVALSAFNARAAPELRVRFRKRAADDAARHAPLRLLGVTPMRRRTCAGGGGGAEGAGRHGAGPRPLG